MTNAGAVANAGMAMKNGDKKRDSAKKAATKKKQFQTQTISGFHIFMPI